MTSTELQSSYWDIMEFYLFYQLLCYNGVAFVEPGKFGFLLSGGEALG